MLSAAEQIFAVKGYAGATLRDIATAVGIRHASLYHHAPGGKEELFVAVTMRTLQRHRNGLEAALASAPASIRAQLYAVADWLLAQAPMDLVRMVHADMPAIDPVQAERLSRLALDSLITPVEQALQAAARNGEINEEDLGVVAGGLVGMIESLHSIPDASVARDGRTRAQIAHRLIDVMLDGLNTHNEENTYVSSALLSQSE
ncbi:MAG: TetR/AcrR family transcriptional regulator [Caldilinea sp.]